MILICLITADNGYLKSVFLIIVESCKLASTLRSACCRFVRDAFAHSKSEHVTFDYEIRCTLCVKHVYSLYCETFVLLKHSSRTFHITPTELSGHSHWASHTHTHTHTRYLVLDSQTKSPPELGFRPYWLESVLKMDVVMHHDWTWACGGEAHSVSTRHAETGGPYTLEKTHFSAYFPLNKISIPHTHKAKFANDRHFRRLDQILRDVLAQISLNRTSLRPSTLLVSHSGF